MRPAACRRGRFNRKLFLARRRAENQLDGTDTGVLSAEPVAQ